MQRISTITKVLDLFGVGKHGFRDGDLATGILPTDLDAAWFNGLQEEVVAIIEAAGIAPSGASLAQLLLALRSAGVFQTQAINDATTKVATTAFVNPGSSLAVNGYLKLPSGLIIQWGISASITSGSSVSVTFPVAFPTACLQAFGTTVTPSSLVSTASISVNSTPSPSALSIYASWGDGVPKPVAWFALGK